MTKPKRLGASEKLLISGALPTIWKKRRGAHHARADEELMMPEVDEIKSAQWDTLRHASMIMLVPDEFGGWTVHQWWPDGVAPAVSYPNAESAAARVLQIMKIKTPVAPQDHPEIARIGRAE